MLELVHGYLDTRVNIIQSRKVPRVVANKSSSNEVNLPSTQDFTIGVSDIPERTKANVSLEISFLVLLCSSDLDICSMTTHAIALLCEEGRLTENPEDLSRSNLTLMRNFPVYSELSLQTFRITGPVAFQKRLRKLLTRMSMPSPGILTAWEAVFMRWRTLCKHILSQGVAVTGRLDDRLHAEWRNYSGFLASIGGCCIADVPAHLPPHMRVTDASLAGLKWIDRLTSDGDSMSLLERFMKQCLQLLVCKLVSVRENIREVLGTELNPRLYLQLFRSLETELSIVLDPSKEAASESRTLFAEQICSLLKTIVERLEEAQDTFLTVDLGAMTLSLARYLHTLKEDYTTLRVKIRMCNLAELVARKKEILNLRQDVRVRNSLLQILAEWMSSKSKNPEVIFSAQGYKRDEFIRLQRDLDRACLRAIVNLLYRLPLQPPDSSHDADVVDARSLMFCNYFTSFLSLLDFSHLESDRRTDLQTASLARDDAASFQELAIQALSNLLSANVDVGLKFSLEIGYHESLETRTAFMHVLTNILTQGTEFGTLGDSAIGEKYERLIDVGSNLLLQSQFTH
jgi:neurofibromin 1